MIWIPIFAYITHLALFMYTVRQLESTQNEVCGSKFDLDGVLNEVSDLKIGFLKNNTQIAILLLIFFIVSMLLVMGFFLGVKPLGWFSFAKGAEIGVGIGIFISLMPLLGFNPRRRGAILLDREMLKVPKFFRVHTFQQGKTQVWIFHSGCDSYSCLVRDDQSVSYFVVNERSAELLELWASLAIE